MHLLVTNREQQVGQSSSLGESTSLSLQPLPPVSGAVCWCACLARL